MTRSRLLIALVSAGVFGAAGIWAGPVRGQRVVPGAGTRIDYVGDDFEDPQWSFIHRLPKSSRELDERSRSPLGNSTNLRWMEGPERGQPDHMKVIPTPPGGLPGSEYSLLMMTLNSGVPGRRSYDVQQDDLIVNCVPRLGTSISVSEIPSCVVRLYLPPPVQWENRSGPHFGFRSGMSTTTRKSSGGRFRSRSSSSVEPYWPGMWIHFRSETSRNVNADSAFIKVRGDRSGRDFKVLEIEEFGWWTLGMSFTADGQVHYFASPGVDPLTAADHVTSQYPYSYRAQRFRTFFFNVCNRNDGVTWSTPFVIDDPKLYVVNSSRITSIVQRKQEAAMKKAEAQAKARAAKQQAATEAKAQPDSGQNRSQLRR